MNTTDMIRCSRCKCNLSINNFYNKKGKLLKTCERCRKPHKIDYYEECIEVINFYRNNKDNYFSLINESLKNPVKNHNKSHPPKKSDHWCEITNSLNESSYYESIEKYIKENEKWHWLLNSLFEHDITEV